MVDEPKKSRVVLRVRVERKGGKWRLVKQVRVPEMTIPHSVDLPAPARAGRLTGSWFEAVDERGKVLYRRMFHMPPPGVEVFEEDGTISRVTKATDDYCTDLLLPDLPEVSAVRVFSEQLGKEVEVEPAKAARPVVPVAVFQLREGDAPKPSAEERR
jgi:hypothetical protein